MEMSESGAPPPEEDFSLIPLLERSVHKNWKARLSAYTEAINKFQATASDDDPYFRPYIRDGELMRKWVTDSNVVAQEKGVEAVTVLLAQAGETAAGLRSDVMPAMVDKCFGAMRQGTKTRATEAALLFVEVENSGEGVVLDVLKGLDAKQPKIVAQSAKCLGDIVSAFGIKPLGSLKPLLKSLEKIFAHTDKTVRAEGTALAQALHLYLGAALTPALTDIKDIQRNALTATFAEMDAAGQTGGSGRPTRYTRREQAQRQAAEAAGAGADDEEADAPPDEVDPLAFVEAVDPVKILPANFMDVIASAKWKDKNDLCEDCLKILEANPVLLDNPDMGAYAQALGKRMTDTNVNVVANAARVIGALAAGIQNKGFAKHRGVVVPPMLERLKEKKKNVTEAIGNALDAVARTTTFDDLAEDCMTALGNKNPQVREGTLAFIARSLSTTKQAPSKGIMQSMVPAQIIALGDADATVRTAAADGIGCFMKIFGDRALNPFLESVTSQQKEKVTEAAAKATVLCKAGGAAPAPVRALAPSVGAANRPPAPKVPAAAGKPASKPAEPKAPISVKPAPARLAPKAALPASAAIASNASSSSTSSGPKAMAPAKPTTGASGTAKPQQVLSAAASDPVRFKYSQEDAEAQAAAIIPAEVQKDLASAQWKERLTAIESFVAWLEGGEAEAVEPELLCRFFAKTPSWNEKNFQVCNLVYRALAISAEKNASFGRSAAALAIPALTEKLGDLKSKKPAGDTLVTLAERTSLAFVLAQSYEPLGKQKAPRAQADALTWIKQALTDFGIAGISLKDLIAFVKTNLQSSNALVRSSATSVLVTLRLFVGGAVDSFIEDLNSQLKTTITSEFAKVEGQAAPEPTRISAELRESAAAGSKTAASSAADPLDDLVPRVDLDKLVAQTTAVAGASSPDWKVRKEGLESLLALLEVKSNTRLKSNMGDIAAVLKGRCADTNLAVKNLALTIIAKIATGMGQPFDKYSRPLATAVAGVAADQKATTRGAAVTCLQAMSEACEGLDSMVAGLATALESTNPALRSTILGFIGADFTAREPSSSIDLSGLIMPVLSSLEDRNGDVRKAAQVVLPFVVSRAGYNQVASQTSALKAASRATVMPMLDAARDAAAAQKKKQVAAKSAVPAKVAETAGQARASAAPVMAAASAAAPTIARPEQAARGLVGARGMSLKSTIKAPAAASRPAYEEVVAKRPASRLDGAKAVGTGSSSSKAENSIEVPPFHSIEQEAKTVRARKDGSKWNSETATSHALLELLSKQMEAQASPELLARLFSVDRSAEKDHIAGLTMMEEFYDSAVDPARYGLTDDLIREIRLANIDLPIKYASARMRDGITQLTLKCLDLLANIVEVVDRTAGNGFSDAESLILIPALIGKLGDNKFKDKLAGIFATIDRTVAGSKVVLYYQDYGITSHNSKTRAASMEMLAQLIRRRGDIVTTGGNGGKLYKRIAEFIGSPDNATRTAALDCIAYLYKIHGDAVYQALGDLKSNHRDLLDKRIATLASAPAAKPSGIPVHVKQSPPRPSSGRASPAPNRLSRPSSTQSSPRSDSAAGRPSSRLQDAALHVNGTDRRVSTEAPSPPAAPLLAPRSRPSAESIGSTIGNILTADSDKSVDALKKVQRVLEESPQEINGSVQELIEAVHSQLQRIFLAPDALEDSKVFRLTKHLVQTMSNFCDHQDLVEQVDPDNMMILLEQLTIGLLRTDMATGDIKEMSRYMNMTILRLFATGRRGTIFSALFALLLQLTRGLSPDTPRDSMTISHAELILKCIWKRSRTAEEDFKRKLLDPRDLLRTIESFMVDIPPMDWRQRAADQVSLGDMPLRTIKVLIQHIVATYGDDRTYDLLTEAFPTAPDQTHVYTYIYRLISTGARHEAATQAGSSAAAAAPPVERAAPPSLAPATESNGKPPAPTEKAGDFEPQPSDDLESELLGLIDVVQPKGGGAGRLDEGMPALHAFLKEHPDKNPFFEALLNARLGQSAYKMFIKRKLHNMSKDQGRVTATEGKSAPSPPASPARPSVTAATTASSTPESTTGGDAQTNARLEQLKSKFKSMNPAAP